MAAHERPIVEENGKESYSTVKDAAAFIGVPANTMYKMLLARVIPSYKMGKLRRVKMSEVSAFVESNRVEAVKTR